MSTCAKALQHWKVLPHGELVQLTPKIMTVVGDIKMPLTTLERRMTVVKLSGDRLVIYNGIALSESHMQAIERFGTPTFLIVPNHMHRSDAFIWKQRYPSLQVVTAPGARAAVEEVVPVSTTSPDFQDASVKLSTVAGTGERECVLEIEEGDGVSLLVTDVIGNLPPEHGVVLRALGFASHTPRIPRAVRLALLKDKTQLKTQLAEWARQNVKRIVVAHGRPIVQDAPNVLRSLASSL